MQVLIFPIIKVTSDRLVNFYYKPLDVLFIIIHRIKIVSRTIKYFWHNFFDFKETAKDKILSPVWVCPQWCL